MHALLATPSLCDAYDGRIVLSEHIRTGSGAQHPFCH